MDQASFPGAGDGRGGVLARTPLYEGHLALGAKMVAFAGYEMPLEYSGILREHRAVRESAGVFDIAHMSTFRVFGFGAFDALQRLLTNDLGKLHAEETHELGRAQYTLMLDDQGGILDDLIVYHSGDLEYLIVGNAANHMIDAAWFAERLPDEVEFADESDRAALLALQGPRAIEIIGELGGSVPDERFKLGEASLDKTPVLLARTGYTGEDGVEIVCPVSRVVGVWRALLSFPEVTPCGLGARDTLRLEMGYHLHGQDMDRDTDPVSAGLEWVVAWDKPGGFVGREAAIAVRDRGPERRLVGLTLDQGIPRQGQAVLHDGKEVGTVTSGTFSPTLRHGIGLAYVPAAFAQPGMQLEVAIRSKLAAAVVTRPPFVKSTSL